MVATHTEAKAGLGTLEHSCFLLILYCTVLQTEWLKRMWCWKKDEREEWEGKVGTCGRNRKAGEKGRVGSVEIPTQSEGHSPVAATTEGMLQRSSSALLRLRNYSGYELQGFQSQTEWQCQAVSRLYLSGLSQNVYYLILFKIKPWEPKEWVPCL